MTTHVTRLAFAARMAAFWWLGALLLQPVFGLIRDALFPGLMR